MIAEGCLVDNATLLTHHNDRGAIEAVLRSTWAHNESLEVARVYRRDEVLVVVWAVSETPSCWEAVNAVVARRLRRQSLSSAFNSEAGGE